ncbi:MAG TPA: hypothetical protein VGE55_02050 [Limnobacter sp.]|uniref:hypothetical protein n=1 Tax=Limnobacter sp. TaxID=2003368 RepID=UPI002ED853B3
MLKPLDVARAHVSDHYQRKYGIHILPAAAPAHGEGWVRYLNRTARLAEGHAVGLVLRGLRNPYYNPRSNYEDHVVPVVLQLDNGWLNLISLDSLGETSPGFTGLGAALKAEGCRVRSAAPVVCRQADEQSCHTDAMQVLKDLLVRHQGSSCRSIWQFLVGEQAIKPESSGHGTQPLALPFWLNKTTQRSKALPPQATAHVDIVAHRKKYAAAFPVRGAGLTGKVANQFLLLKAVRNAEHLVDTLTGIPGRHERQAWLAALQRRHGLLVQ